MLYICHDFFNTKEPMAQMYATLLVYIRCYRPRTLSRRYVLLCLYALGVADPPDGRRLLQVVFPSLLFLYTLCTPVAPDTRLGRQVFFGGKIV